MSQRVLTVDRHKEIERLLADGRGVREIKRALKCLRQLVRQIRDGLHGSPDQRRSTADPPRMAQVNWPEIVHDLGLAASRRFTPSPAIMTWWHGTRSGEGERGACRHRGRAHPGSRGHYPHRDADCLSRLLPT